MSAKTQSLLFQIVAYLALDKLLPFLFVMLGLLFGSFTGIFASFMGATRFIAYAVINFAFHRRLNAKAVWLSIAAGVAFQLIIQLLYFLPQQWPDILYYAFGAALFISFYFIMAWIYCLIDKEAGFKKVVNKVSIPVMIGLLAMYIVVSLNELHMLGLSLGNSDSSSILNYLELMNVGAYSGNFTVTAQYVMMVVLSAFLPFHEYQPAEGQPETEGQPDTEKKPEEKKWKFNWRRY